MPTYEYACAACGYKFEEFQSIKAKPTTVCPKCKKKKVQRLISAGGGFIFKGSGFYSTDYRTENYKAGEKSAADAAKPPSTEKSDSTKTDSTKTAATAKTDSAPAKSESKPAPAAPAPAAAPAKGGAKSESKSQK